MTRYLFICALLVFAQGAFADGEYQRTKNGKTMVWNSDPKPGDEAAWSGARDGEGYASGFGTLTWYTGRKENVRRRGIRIPLTESDVYARYFGNMVRGKFNGPVNVHSDRKTAHALFIDGVRSSSWIAGRAPSRMRQPPVEVAKQETAEKPASAKGSGLEETASKPSSATEPPAPAEGPAQKPAVKGEVSQSTDRPVPKLPTNKKTQVEFDESLSALVGPPSSLQTNPNTDAARNDTKRKAKEVPSADARLTKEAVVDLADAEARTRGYNPAEYERAEPRYNPSDRIWSINYEQKPLDETMESGKRFSVTVDDKTKGIVFVPGK